MKISKRMGVKSWLPWRHLGFTLIGLIAIAGCTTLQDPEASQAFNSDVVGTISPGHPIGQTFTHRRERFNGITFWVEVEESGNDLTLDLFHSPKDQTPIFSTTVQVNSGANLISIPPQPDPPNQNYFVRLSTTGEGIRVLGRDEDIYPSGSAYQDDRPLQADLAFRTSYDYDLKAAIADLQRIIKKGWLVLPAMVLLFLPGWLLLDIANRRKDLDPGEQIAMSIGLSIALTPVLMLWTTTFGLPWDSASVRVAAVMILVLFVTRLIWTRKSAAPLCIHLPKPDENSFAAAVLLLIFATAFFVRVGMIRDLAAPAWVDSIHHAIITNAILESGVYPENYLPHIPMEATYYHPGFHSLLAAFHWLTGISVADSMLIFGQILNALAVTSVYLLTTTLVKDVKAGLVAALITGLLLLMPAYYVSWGRYTQLAGLLVLSPGIRWIISAQEDRKTFSGILLGGILLAGLFLLHYRVFIFLGCLILAVWIGNLYRPNQFTWKRMVSSIGSIGILGISGSVFGLPWLIPTLKEYALPLVVQMRGNPVFPEVHWQYLTPVFGIPAMILAGAGLLLGILQKRRFSITILVWVLLLIGIANPRYFHLPFPGGFVNQTSVEIMLFLPVSLLGGYSASQGIRVTREWIPTRWKWVHTGTVAILGIGISILGAQRLLPVINPSTLIFREPDEPALAWISANVPEDETIVINPTGWGYGLYMGNDGGFWISPLTGRRTMPPNVLYGHDKGFRETTNQFVEALLPAGENPLIVWELLQEYNYRYIYIGGRGGVISPQSLDQSLLFDTRYQNGGTWVFETRRKP